MLHNKKTYFCICRRQIVIFQMSVPLNSSVKFRLLLISIVRHDDLIQPCDVEDNDSDDDDDDDGYNSNDGYNYDDSCTSGDANCYAASCRTCIYLFFLYLL